MSYGPVWVDLEGTTLLDVEIPILQHKNTGGVLLFTKNYANVEQLKALVADIRKYAGQDILISVDHEGGRKWRFDEGFQKPAAPLAFGELYQKDPAEALIRLQRAGAIVAYELLQCGVDITFAPLLDIDTGISTVIGDRSYGDNPTVVTNCARAFIQGLRKQGMSAVGKHYPGHGGCVMDSHFTAAIDDRSMQEIENFDLVPFATLQQELAGVMPAHVVYSQIDPLPAGFSSLWLQDILRQKLHFKGAVISDCLSMLGSGFASNIIDGAMAALTAGCDMVIISQQTRSHLLEILDAIDWQTTETQRARIKGLAGDFSNLNSRTKPVVANELMEA